eukprot:TRINITY_DN939_c0_g1_i2.p1 TRINITY_DN939_c0_g1~~TRINITY_DN939_c0_g1_i2.p1  ORF type:complete len:261 (+),score=89.88 TRINITY_DN939_c0_g1_i2:35-817(+)
MAVRPSELIPRLAANDASLIEINLTDNATYQMKSADYTKQLVDALSNNDQLKRLTLSKLNITDQSVSLLAELLKTNKSIVYLDVSHNKFGTAGLIAIAESLKSNTTLIELSVIGQSQPFGEAGLQKMTEMFDFNVTLQKINWRLHSRQSFALNKLISRNVDINRRIQAGQKLDDYINLVPRARKGDFGVQEDYIAGEAGGVVTTAEGGGEKQEKKEEKKEEEKQEKKEEEKQEEKQEKKEEEKQEEKQEKKEEEKQENQE